MQQLAAVEIRPAHTRFHTQAGWLDSWHCFSFGRHYDPANTGHGLLLVSNDDTVAPGAGFSTHGHADMEIVTWVLEGALSHRDSTGTDGVIRPGLAQRMSAGTGIRHSEMNASDFEPVHFIQMWVPPDTPGVEPGYEQRDVSDALAGGELVAVASGRGHDGAVHLHQRDAVMWAARLAPEQSIALPAAASAHLYLARGSGSLAWDDAARQLVTGDAARLTEAGELGFTAVTDAEIIYWEFSSG